MPSKRAVSRSAVPRRLLSQAARADRHSLYEQSVQDSAWEAEFIEHVYTSVRGHAPQRLREDFCGTALFAREWVRRGRQHEAVGVDLDPGVLEWCRTHGIPRLAPSAARRLTLLQADVRTANSPPADVLIAFNFSYWVFMDRAALRRYFKCAHAALAQDGIFMLDAYGGPDAYRITREREDMGRFTYIWDQADYDPVSGHITCHIHFAFPDGSRINRAFSYHWRLWSLPELRELLAEAGFSKNTVWWEGTNPKTGEGNGKFEPVENAAADTAWVAYIVAEK
jgi:Methyltransferase domain